MWKSSKAHTKRTPITNRKEISNWWEFPQLSWKENKFCRDWVWVVKEWNNVNLKSYKELGEEK